MKPRYVYHASLKGNIKEFVPKNPNDIGTNKSNKHKGVYATNDKKWARSFGVILNHKNVSGVGETEKGVKGICYFAKEVPKKGYFYIYIFDARNFKNIPANSHQYICREKIRPIKKEKFWVKNNQRFARIATEKENKRMKKRIAK